MRNLNHSIRVILIASALVVAATASAALLPADAGFEGGVRTSTRILIAMDGSGPTTPVETTPAPTDPPTTAPPTTTSPPPETTPTPTDPPTKTPETTTSPPTTAPNSNSKSSDGTTPKPTSNTNSTTSSATSESSTNTAVVHTSSGATDSSGTSSLTSSSSVDGAKADQSTSASHAATITTEKSSKMGTGTIIGIVAGIVCAVALLAFIVMGVRRKRRDSEDDPLSPFELSMEKRYNPGTYISNVGRYNNADNSDYSNNAINASNSAQEPADPSAVEAAGIAYGNANAFYDSVTSPEAMEAQAQQQQYDEEQQYQYQQQATNASSNGTGANNEWMTAMKHTEAQQEEVEPGFAAELLQSSGSYDQSPSFSGIDADQSSVISDNSGAGSNNNDVGVEYPEFIESSSRGSYEL